MISVESGYTTENSGYTIPPFENTFGKVDAVMVNILMLLLFYLRVGDMYGNDTYHSIVIFALNKVFDINFWYHRNFIIHVTSVNITKKTNTRII